MNGQADNVVDRLVSEVAMKVGGDWGTIKKRDVFWPASVRPSAMLINWPIFNAKLWANWSGLFGRDGQSLRITPSLLGLLAGKAWKKAKKRLIA